MDTRAISMPSVRANILRFGERQQSIGFTDAEIFNLDSFFGPRQTVIETKPFAADGRALSIYIGRQNPFSDLNVVLQQNGCPVAGGNFWLKRQERTLCVNGGKTVVGKPKCIGDDATWQQILAKLKELTAKDIKRRY